MCYLVSEQEEKKKNSLFFVSYNISRSIIYVEKKQTWNIRLPNLGSIETKKKKLIYTEKEKCSFELFDQVEFFFPIFDYLM
jgi:hypothetical protein